MQEFVQRTRTQGGLLWDTVKQKQVWLPALFIFLWQATPSLGLGLGSRSGLGFGSGLG